MSRQPRSSYGVVIDIGSGSVGVGIVVSHHDKTAPEIIYTYREPMRIGEAPSGEERIRALRHALFSAALALNQTGLKKLKTYDRRARVARVLLVCAAPWSITIMKLVHFEKDEPFTVTKDIVEDLIREVEERDTKEARSMIAIKDMRVRLTERAVINTMLNGYLVHEPYGKKARELTLAHLSGLVPDEILKAVKEIEKHTFGHAKETIHTHALVLYCIFRDIYPHTKDALIVDVSGESTEIGAVIDHILYETKVVPYGVNTLIRDVAKRLSTIPEEARAHIAAYAEGTAHEKVIDAVRNATLSYQTHLSEAYLELSQKYVLPRQIFVAAQTLEDFFKKTLGEAVESGPAAPTVTTVGSKTLEQLASFAEGEGKDVFLAICGRFFHKLHACGEIE